MPERFEPAPDRVLSAKYKISPKDVVLAGTNQGAIMGTVLSVDRFANEATVNITRELDQVTGQSHPLGRIETFPLNRLRPLLPETPKDLQSYWNDSR